MLRKYLQQWTDFWYSKYYNLDTTKLPFLQQEIYLFVNTGVVVPAKILHKYQYSAANLLQNIPYLVTRKNFAGLMVTSKGQLLPLAKFSSQSPSPLQSPIDENNTLDVEVEYSYSCQTITAATNATRSPMLVKQFFDQKFMHLLEKRLKTTILRLPDVNANTQYRNYLYVYADNGEIVSRKAKIYKYQHALYCNNRKIVSKYKYDLAHKLLVTAVEQVQTQEQGDPAEKGQNISEKSTIELQLQQTNPDSPDSPDNSDSPENLDCADNLGAVSASINVNSRVAEIIAKQQQPLSEVPEDWLCPLTGESIAIPLGVVPRKIGMCYYWQGKEVVKQQDFAENSYVYADTGENIYKEQGVQPPHMVREIIRAAEYKNRQYVLDLLATSAGRAHIIKIMEDDHQDYIAEQVQVLPRLDDLGGCGSTSTIPKILGEAPDLGVGVTSFPWHESANICTELPLENFDNRLNLGNISSPISTTNILSGDYIMELFTEQLDSKLIERLFNITELNFEYSWQQDNNIIDTTATITACESGVDIDLIARR